MNPLLPCLTVFALFSFSVSAKVSCEADLALVTRLVADNHLELPVHHEVLFVMSHPAADVRTRKAAQLFASIVDQHCLTATAFMDTPHRRACAGDVITSRGEFKDKRKLARLETARFLLIDSVEAFVYDLAPDERDANLAQLRRLIALRVREGRPTVLVFEDPANFELYLSNLFATPKSAASADKK